MADWIQFMGNGDDPAMQITSTVFVVSLTVYLTVLMYRRVWRRRQQHVERVAVAVVRYEICKLFDLMLVRLEAITDAPGGTPGELLHFGDADDAGDSEPSLRNSFGQSFATVWSAGTHPFSPVPTLTLPSHMKRHGSSRSACDEGGGGEPARRLSAQKPPLHTPPVSSARLGATPPPPLMAPSAASLEMAPRPPSPLIPTPSQTPRSAATRMRKVSDDCQSASSSLEPTVQRPRAATTASQQGAPPVRDEQWPLLAVEGPSSRSPATTWYRLLRQDVRNFVDLEDTRLLREEECEDILARSLRRLHQRCWFVHRDVGRALVTRAMVTLYHEYQHRLLMEFLEFSLVLHRIRRYAAGTQPHGSPVTQASSRKEVRSC